VGVVRRLHDGATDASGKPLEQKISHEWGAELDWTLFVPDAQGQTTFRARPQPPSYRLSGFRYRSGP
jgi:hypothetical protein